VIDMPIVSIEDAIPIVNERAEFFKKAIYSAADVNLELSNDYLIKNWLGEIAISVVYGDSNSGKSFFAVDLAYHVASGKNWFGNRVKSGHVLYIAAEGGRGFNKRIFAVKNSKPDLHKGGCKNLMLLPVQVDLHGAEDASAIINQTNKQNYKLLVIDTLAMSIGEGSENDGRDMGIFLTNIMRLKAHFNCHIMIIHHTGKDKSKGARGHSSLRAALDTEIELKVDGLARIAKATKQRDMESGKKIAFTLDVVELGLDIDKDRVTSCVINQTDIPEISTKKKKLSGNNEVAHQALHDAITNHGHNIKNSKHYPASRKVVNDNYWLDEFRLRREDDAAKPEAIRKSYTRARDWLQDHDYIREYNNKIWFVYEEDRQDK